MNILKESGQQLEVWHEDLMTTRTHDLTTIAQSLTSIEYRLKIIYLTLLSITAIGYLLWGYVDYDLCREQYSMTSFPTKIVGNLAGTIFTIANIQRAQF